MPLVRHRVRASVARSAALSFLPLATSLFGSLVTGRANAADLLIHTGTGVDCASDQAIRDAVAKRLGRDPFLTGDPSSNAHVVTNFEAPEGVYRARISVSIDGQSSTREITGSSCESVVDASALAISLALGEASSGSSNARGNGHNSPQPTPVTPRDIPTESANVNQPEPPRSIALGVIASLGILPQPAAGGALHVRGKLGANVDVLIGGLFLPSTSTPEESFRVGFILGRIGGCFVGTRSDRFHVDGCASAIVGNASPSQDKAVVTPDSNSFYAAVSMSASLRWMFARPVFAEASVEAIFPITRERYITQTCPIYGFQQPPVAGALYVMPGIAF